MSACYGKAIFGNLTKHTNLLIQANLKAAGILYRNGSDRVADSHALRHSFITALAMSKAPVKVIQSLARHSTPTLTLGIYAHVGLYDQSSALDALPGVAPSHTPVESGELTATGTGGKDTSNCFSLPFPFGGVGTDQNLSVTVGCDDVIFKEHAGSSEDPQVLDSSEVVSGCHALSDTSKAEGVGFEPTVGLHLLRFSRPSQSATLAPLRVWRTSRGYWPTSFSTSSET